MKLNVFVAFLVALLAAVASLAMAKDELKARKFANAEMEKVYRSPRSKVSHPSKMVEKPRFRTKAAKTAPHHRYPTRLRADN